MKGKYMAYVGSYSYTGKAKGITVFDVDVEKGQFQYRCEMEVDNSSYVIASSDGKTITLALPCNGLAGAFCAVSWKTEVWPG